jgi:hypothetical protein
VRSPLARALAAHATCAGPCLPPPALSPAHATCAGPCLPPPACSCVSSSRAAATGFATSASSRRARASARQRASSARRATAASTSCRPTAASSRGSTSRYVVWRRGGPLGGMRWHDDASEFDLVPFRVIAGTHTRRRRGVVVASSQASSRRDASSVWRLRCSSSSFPTDVCHRRTAPSCVAR